MTEAAKETDSIVNLEKIDTKEKTESVVKVSENEEINEITDSNEIDAKQNSDRTSAFEIIDKKRKNDVSLVTEKTEKPEESDDFTLEKKNSDIQGILDDTEELTFGKEKQLIEIKKVSDFDEDVNNSENKELTVSPNQEKQTTIELSDSLEKSDFGAQRSTDGAAQEHYQPKDLKANLNVSESSDSKKKDSYVLDGISAELNDLEDSSTKKNSKTEDLKEDTNILISENKTNEKLEEITKTNEGLERKTIELKDFSINSDGLEEKEQIKEDSQEIKVKVIKSLRPADDEEEKACNASICIDGEDPKLEEQRKQNVENNGDSRDGFCAKCSVF